MKMNQTKTQKTKRKTIKPKENKKNNRFYNIFCKIIVKPQEKQ